MRILKGTNLMIVGMVVLFVAGVLTSSSFAKIDPETIVGIWLFDEGQGDVAKDSSENGLDGEFTGNPEWVDGKFGKALEFDGASYVTIPSHVTPAAAATISAWVKSAAGTWNSAGWIVEKRDAYLLHPNAGSTNVSFCIANGGLFDQWNLPQGWNAGAVGPKDKDITNWHMYTGTYESSTGEWKIYIDGELESALDLDKAEIREDAGPVHIGWDQAGNAFGQGIIDEVSIYNVALSKDDIQTIMEGLSAVLAVEHTGKLTTTWGKIRAQDYL